MAHAAGSQRLITGLVLVAAACVCLPWQPSVDTAHYEAQMHWAFAEGWRHGHDIAATYGPLGFLVLPIYHAQTWIPSLLYHAVLLVLTLATVKRYWLRQTGGNPPAWVWLLLLLLPVASLPPYKGAGQILPFTLVVAWVLNAWHPAAPRRDPLSLATVVVFAPIVLTKTVFWPPLACGLLARAAAPSGLRPLLRAELPALVLALALSWRMSGQHFGDLGTFVAGALDVVAGFKEAMSAGGTVSNLPMLLFALTAATWLVAFVVATHRRLGMRAAIPGAVVAVSMFVLFQHAFTRSFGLVWHTATLLGIGALLWPLDRQLIGRTRWAFRLALILPATLLVADVVRELGIRRQTIKLSSRLGERLVAPFELIFDAESRPAARSTNQLARLRDTVDLAGISGSVAIPAGDSGLLRAWGLTQVPWPSVTSYSAYTSGLMERNMVLLEGPRAPDTILFRPPALKGNHPTLADGHALLALARLYRAREPRGHYEVLTRRDTPLVETRTPIARLRGRLGQRLELPPAGGPPAGGPLFAKLHMPRSAPARALAAVWPFRPLEIAVEWSDQQAVYRVFPRLAAAGFLLSPHVASLGDFAALFGDPRAADLPRVAAITLRLPRAEATGTEAWVYAEEFEVELFELSWQERD